MSSEAPAAWAHGLDPLLREGHRRLGSGHPVKQIRLGSLDHHEQEAIADLLGGYARPAPGQKVPWARVEEFVERVTGRPTRVVLEELYGPIGNRLAEQAAKADARATLWAWLREHDVVRKQELHGWAAEVEARGLRGTVDGTRSLLEQTLAVLDALPSTGEPLPVFAGRVLNDTHALDGGTGVAGLVLAALAGRQGVPRPSRAAERRGVWQTVGIADDALSSTVLVAGLDAVGSAPADDLCRLASAVAVRSA